MMKLQAFILVMLILCVSAKRRMRVRSRMPKPEGPCDMVQMFNQDFIYTYKYVAITEHRDDANGRRNDVRITCTVTISVPRRCSGNLRVSDCRVEEGTMTRNGQIDYQLLPTSPTFEREMGVTEMAFHFNGGQITKMFIDKQERSSITNFKRGILSSLQAYNPKLPKTFEVGDVFEVPQVSVYGQGVVEHKILQKTDALPSEIEVVRDTSKIDLPWERKQWNFIRMQNGKLNPMLAAFRNYITINSEQMWSKSKQNCRYTLDRGRQVSSARCEERHPLNPVRPGLLKNLFSADLLATTIRQEVDLQTSRKMTASDRSRWDVSRFDEDNIMFEEEWEDTNIVYANGFDAEAAFLRLVQAPINDKSPALVSKLSRWITIAKQDELEKVWAKCDDECSPKEKEAGRILWAELLNSCIVNDWCQIPHCGAEKSIYCENAMETFLRSHTNESQEVKEAYVASLESIYAPSEKIVEAALRICRAEEKTTPMCVRTLATVTTNFLQTCEIDCETSKPVTKAKAFLERQLDDVCNANNDETAEVMATAVEWIGRLGPDGRYAEIAVLNCATNPAAPADVVIKALVAYGNITGESLNIDAAKKLVSLFKNKEEKLETRIVCFHVLMRKNLQFAELEEVLTTVMDEDEHSVLTEQCLEDLRTQLVLRGTMFSQFNAEVARKSVELIRNKRWGIKISHEALYYNPIERNYEITRELHIPYFKAATQCTVRIDSVFEKNAAIVPIMSKLTVLTNIEGRNVTILEMAFDIASMKPIMDSILGHDMFYAEMLGKLLKTPLYELHGYSKQYPAMNALKMEGRHAYVRNVFNSRSPICLKVFGYDVSLDSFLGLDAIRRLTLGNVWKILDALETGFKHEAFVVDQPFLMQYAAPTGIGAPITSTIDFSYILKSKLHLKVNLRRILFTPNEKAIINMAPEFHVNGIITRTVLAQFSESSGTELNLKFGHGSGIVCGLSTTFQGFNAVCTPKLGKTELFYLNGKGSLTGAGPVAPDGSVCFHQRMEDLCSIQFCFEPFSATGFNYQLLIENQVGTEYRSVISFISRAEEETKETVKEFKTELTAENHLAAKKVLWASIISFTPSRNELRCNVINQWFRWRAVGDLMLPRHNGRTGLSASFRASGMESLQYKYFAALKITPEFVNKYVVVGECKSKSAESEFKGFKVNGILEEGKNATRNVEFGFYDIERNEEPLFKSQLLSKKVSGGLERIPGFESHYTLSGSLLPYHQRYNFDMLTFHDDIRYKTILGVSGHFGDGRRDAQFYAHEIKGNWKRQNYTLYDLEINGASNLFSYEYIARHEANDDDLVRARCDFPEKPISFSEVFTGTDAYSYNLKSVDRPVASFVEWNYTDARLETGDREHGIKLGYRFWDVESRDYRHETGLAKYTKHCECYYCHTLVLTHPQVQLTSIKIANSPYYHEEKWLKLHYSLLDYIHMRPYISYYLLNNLQNEYLEVGFKAKQVPREGGSLIEVEAAVLKNAANCTMDISDNWGDHKAACKVDISAIPLTVDFKLGINDQGESRHAVVVDSEAKYAGSGFKVEGEVKFSREKTEFIFTSAYGTEDSYEHENTFEMQSAYAGDRCNITGSYVKTYMPTGKVEEYKFIGNSQKIGFINYDLEIEALCPTNSEKVCVKFAVNKGENWIQYERLVREDEYDRVIISEDSGKITVQTKTVDEIFWGVRAFTATLKISQRSSKFSIISPISNVTFLHDDNTGLLVHTVFDSHWLKYRMVAAVNSTTAKYDIEWDGREAGGVKTRSASSINYVILYWYKPFSSRVTLGAAPESFKCELQIPDFDFEFYHTTEESNRPTTYKYFFDANIKPYSIAMNELKFPVFEREVRVSDTTIGIEHQRGAFYGVFAHDLKVSLSPACNGIKPLVVTGKCVLNRDTVLIKMADADGLFGVDVAIDSTIQNAYHVEFLLNPASSKVKLLWDMKNNNNEIRMVAECDIGTVCWKTKKITSIFTVNMNNALGMTPDGGNFPDANINLVFSHDLPIPYIPKKNEVALSTIINGGTTTLRYLAHAGELELVDGIAKMTGCHQRFSLLPGLSFCMPDDVATNMTFEISRSVRVENTYTLKKVAHEWVFAIVNYLHAPVLAEKPIRTTLNTRIETSSCLEVERWCLPRKILFKDLECDVSSTYGRWLNRVSPGFLKPFIFNKIHLSRSYITINRSEINEISKHGIYIIARDAETDEETSVILTSSVASNELAFKFDVVGNQQIFKHDFEVEYEPETLGWRYNHELDCPWLYTVTAISASSPFVITSCKTKTATPGGFLRNFNFSYTDHKIDGDIELEIGVFTGRSTHTFAWEPTTMEWETAHIINYPWMNLDAKLNGGRSPIDIFVLDLKTHGTIHSLSSRYADGDGTCKCNIGTFEFELEKRGNEFRCDLKSRRYPSADQTVVLDIFEEGRYFNWSATHETQYHTCISKFSSEGFAVKGRLLDCKMKSSGAGLKVEYVPEGASRLCRIALTDGGDIKISCSTTPMANEHTEAHLKCERREGANVAKFASIPVTMVDFPFMGDYVIIDKAVFAARLTRFLHKTIVYDEKKLGIEYQKKIGCSDEKICFDFAKSAKTYYYSYLTELKRVTDVKTFYYLTKPEIMQYALHMATGFFPGTLSILPEYSSVEQYSVATNFEKVLSSGEIRLLHWSFLPFIELKLGATFTENSTLVLKSDLSSALFPWVDMTTTFLVEESEGRDVLKMAGNFYAWKYSGIFGLKDGEIRIATDGQCQDTCEKDMLLKYKWIMESAERRNLSLVLLRGDNVQIACDLLFSPANRNDAEIRCYEDLRREVLIGKITFSELSHLSILDFADLDAVLRDVVHMNSKENINKVYAAAKLFGSKIARYLQSHYHVAETSSLLLNGLQYATATFLHETVKHTGVHEVYGILYRFYESSIRLETFEDLVGYFSDTDAVGGIWRLTRSVMAPLAETLGYVLGGRIEAGYEFRDGALFVRTTASPASFPVFNFEAELRIERVSYSNIIFNFTATNAFVTVSADAHLDGPRFIVEKARFGLPGEEEEFLELRIVPNNVEGEPYTVQMFFADREGQEYACRGSRRSYKSEVIYMQCYLTQGTELPPDLSSAYLIAYWDFDIVDVPHAARSGMNGLWNVFVTVFQAIKARSDDPASIDDDLLKVYHVHDATIRRRLSRTIGATCRNWVEAFENGLARTDEGRFVTNESKEKGLESLVRKYKSRSYEMLKSSVIERINARTNSPVSFLDFGFVSDLARFSYVYTAPLVHDLYSVAEYMEASGSVKLAQCTACDGAEDFRFETGMKSAKYPNVDYDFIAKISSVGFINASISGSFGWVEIESEISASAIVPKRARIGLANDLENGVEVVFRMENDTDIQPAMSFVFNTHQRYVCDAQSDILSQPIVRCHSYKNDARGPEIASCQITLWKIRRFSEDLVIDAIGGDIPELYEVSRALEKFCEFKDSEFKDSLSKSLVADIDFVGDYCRNLLKDTLKAHLDLFNIAYSTLWKAIADYYDWLYDHLSTFKNIRISRYFRDINKAVSVLLEWCKSLTLNINESVKVLYETVYVVNKFIYDVSKIRLDRAGEYWANTVKGYQNYRGYMKIWGSSFFAGDNCVFGMIHGAEFEQVITINNHLYYLPKTFKTCPYLLAGDVAEEALTVVFNKNDLIINLPGRSITIDPEMRVYEGFAGSNNLTEVALPYYSAEISCVRTEKLIRCDSLSVVVLVKSENNTRTGFFVKISDIYCPSVRGFMGVGANTTMVPRMLLMNGKVAPSLEEYTNAYSTEKSCYVGKIHSEPEEQHEHCDALFEREQWKDICPNRRRAFLKACRTGAQTPAEACRYAADFNTVCNVEGRPVVIAPECDICEGKPEKNVSTDKVLVTVILSLSWKTRPTSLQGTLDGIRAMANDNGRNYEVSFVTFGGRGDRFAPALIAQNGEAVFPLSMLWTVPDLTFDGPAPLYQSIVDAMWFAVTETSRTASGVGKIFLFVTPEDVNYSVLTSSTSVLRMREDLIRSYLLTPNNCLRTGGKSRAFYGIRPLFTSGSASVCKRSFYDIAAAIAYPQAKTVTCTCKLVNPYTGETTSNCRQVD